MQRKTTKAKTKKKLLKAFSACFFTPWLLHSYYFPNYGFKLKKRYRLWLLLFWKVFCLWGKGGGKRLTWWKGIFSLKKNMFSFCGKYFLFQNDIKNCFLFLACPGPVQNHILISFQIFQKHKEHPWVDIMISTHCILSLLLSINKKLNTLFSPLIMVLSKFFPS